MDILAHRGLWSSRRSQNTLEAFIGALDRGFGIEFDVRDRQGKLVLAHGPAESGSPLLTEVFRALSRHRRFHCVRYALNVKSDGLQKAIADFVKRFGLRQRCLVFDMSGPELFSYAKQKDGRVTLATRYSDIEQPVLLEEVPWVWMDELRGPWITAAAVARLVRQGKRVAIVSPELHGRGPLPLWRRVRSLQHRILASVSLCTDRAPQAAAFFNSRRS